MVKSIKDVSDGKDVGDVHTVRGDSDDVDALPEHLGNQSLTLDGGTWDE
jgi:hypothetical protein